MAGRPAAFPLYQHRGLFRVPGAAQSAQGGHQRQVVPPIGRRRASSYWPTRLALATGRSPWHGRRGVSLGLPLGSPPAKQPHAIRAAARAAHQSHVQGLGSGSQPASARVIVDSAAIVMVGWLGFVHLRDRHCCPAQASGHVAGGQLQLRAALALTALPAALVKPASHGDAVAFVE